MTDTNIQDSKSIISLIAGADIVVQMVMLVLLIASIWSWSIIIEKWFRLRRVVKKTQYFEKVFSPDRAELLFEKLKGSVFAPIEYVFIAFMTELKSANRVEDINIVVEGTKNREIANLESNLISLAIISSTTLLIGLLGTVWGIMHSFQSIAASKNTSLSVVAPGIAEALFATAMGLVAAIPASIFYNIFTAKISEIENRTDNFSMELNRIASKVLVSA